MSFIFSRALVAASLQGKCSDTDASALLSGSHTPPLFLPSDKTTAFSRLSRFGMTFGHLTEDLGAALLTSWLAGFPVRTSALPEREPESLENDPACGPIWRGSLAKFDLATSSWKTVQLSLLGDSELSSVTWPRSGMTAGGQCWELPTLGRLTSGTASGSKPNSVDFFHTPTVGGLTEEATSGEGLATWVAKWPTPTTPNGGRSVKHVTDWRSERTAYTKDGKKVQVDLAAAVKFATPKARDWKAGGGMRNSPDLPTEIGGALNPTWVEWLQGWPLGWTDLKPSATDKFRFVPQPHGDCSVSENAVRTDGSAGGEG